MSPTPIPSIRGSGFIGPLRSRRGCKTCKIRRIKCGEEKPGCLRCTSTGRKCEYNNEGPIPGTFSSARSMVSIFDNPLSSSPNTVWRERRAFAYYFEHTAPLVGGGLDVDFWTTFVPQICRSEPAVWDAVIAISALFESPEPSPDLAYRRKPDSRALNQHHRDALGWYARSVSAVRQRIERGEIDILGGLISCVLFMCIEALQGGVDEALDLYRQGVRLIVSLRAQVADGAVPATKVALLEDIIAPTFARLGAVALTISEITVTPLLPGVEDALTGDFASLKSTREAIVLLAAEIQLFQGTCQEHLLQSRASQVSPELTNQQAVLADRLNNWHVGFTNLMESLRAKDVLSLQQISTSSLLLSYYETLLIIIATCASPLETRTDAHLPHFQRIVEHSTIALDTSARSDGTQPPFTFEISVGFPLWFCCLRCRDPSVRRAAAALLRRGPQILGFYNSSGAAALCEGIIAFEEMMAFNLSRGIASPTALESIDARDEYHSQGQAVNPNAVFTRETGMPTAAAIPEEARICPMYIFRPEKGCPPMITEHDIAKWKRAGDQTFLLFSQNRHDLATGTKQIVHDCIPIDL